MDLYNDKYGHRMNIYGLIWTKLNMDISLISNGNNLGRTMVAMKIPSVLNGY